MITIELAQEHTRRTSETRHPGQPGISLGNVFTLSKKNQHNQVIDCQQIIKGTENYGNFKRNIATRWASVPGIM